MSESKRIIIFTDHTDVLMMQKGLGAHKVACELRSAGFECFVINHLHTFELADVLAIIKNLVNANTIFVGFSTFFYRSIELSTAEPEHEHEQGGIKFSPKQLGAMLPHGIEHNASVKTLIKQLNPQCKLVIGGPDAQDRSYARDFDYVVIGYGDTATVNLAQHLARGDLLEKSYRSIHGPIIVDDRRAEHYDFSNTIMQYHETDAVLPGETLSIEIARGCIFRCSFCSYPLNGKKKLDYLKHEQILTQEFVDNYRRWGVTRYIMVDDTFNDSREKAEMMHRISKSLPFELEYWANCRLDLMAAHPDTLRLLFDSGLRAAFFGIETLHDQAAKTIGKGGAREKLVQTLNDIKSRYSDQVMLHGSFIFGLPHEPVESMQETARRLSSGELALDSYYVHALKIMSPGLAYSSEIDADPGRFGYTLTGKIPNTNIHTWRNDYTNSEEVDVLAKAANADGYIRTGNSKISGSTSFEIAGLGFDLAHSRNQSVTKFDWHVVARQKESRAMQYKQRLQELGIFVNTI